MNGNDIKKLQKVCGKQKAITQRPGKHFAYDTGFNVCKAVIVAKVGLLDVLNAAELSFNKGDTQSPRGHVVVQLEGNLKEEFHFVAKVFCRLFLSSLLQREKSLFI